MIATIWFVGGMLYAIMLGVSAFFGGEAKRDWIVLPFVCFAAAVVAKYLWP